MRLEGTYWNSICHRRVSRRRALQGAAALGTAFAASGLAACAGEGEEGTAETPRPVETVQGEPQPGGILKSAIPYDVATFDPVRTRAYTTSLLAGFVYSRLVKFKTARGEPADGSVVGDVIESWEQPDELTLIMRMRKGVRFDQRPPTNGRALTIEDIILSWEKYTSDSPYRSELSHAVSEDASIVSVRATDGETIEIKTAFPDAQMLPSMAHSYYLWVLPNEAFTGGYDPATEIRGSGPWILESHQPSVGFTFGKNPNYYEAPQYPLVDGVELPIIVDTAQVEAQFKAKNIHFASGVVIPTPDMLSIRKETKDSYISLGGPSCEAPSIGFSWRPNSPFHDVRVRRAMSMLIDRDTMLDVFSSLMAFQEAGLNMHGYWSSPLASGYRDYWLDPNGDNFGPNAQYYKHDVAEAKALLAAAGYPDGFESPFTFLAGPQYGRDQGQRAEALMSMLAEGGIRCKANPVDYVTVWIPQYLRAHGDFDGAALFATGSRADPGQWLTVFLSSWGANNNTADNFPELDDLIAKQRREFDRSKRINIIDDIQRYCAENMPIVPEAGQVDGPSLNWNGLHGVEEYNAWPGNPWSFAVEVWPYYWLDDRLRG